MEREWPHTGMSFRALYEEHLSMVYRLAYSYLQNPQDSEDAAQECFLRLMKQKREFRDAGHVKAWLIVTVSNVCKDMLRRKQRQELELDEGRDQAAPPETDRELLELILQLPEKYKTVIYLYYYEGYAVREIAAMLSLTAEAVKTRLRRARAMLRVDLEENDNEE